MLIPDYTTPNDRFWSRMDRSGGPDACWEWQGARTRNGYGVLGMGGRVTMYTHRLAYVLAVADLPANLVIMHACDNPPCCNPAHLSPGTRSENAADMVRKGRNRKPPARTGEANNNAKLTVEQVIDMREQYASGILPITLAGEFNVSRGVVLDIVQGTAWGQAGGPITPRGTFGYRRIREPHVDPGDRPRGERHGNAKLTRAVVVEMRQRYAEGETAAALGRTFGVSKHTAWMVVTGKAWQHVE